MTKRDNKSATKLDCPVCASERIEIVYECDKSVSSDSETVDANVSNGFCVDCGTVYNRTGVRGREAEFYANDYDLLSDNAAAEFTYLTDAGRRGVSDELVDFLVATDRMKERGRVLEVGCGKGILLSRFAQRWPSWSIAAVEPSKNARAYLADRIPGVDVHEGALADSPFLEEKFDLVISIGVLEHIAEPIGFLDTLKGCLTKDGHALISVPNFVHNPIDLLTYDHLTRFTPASLRLALQQVGLGAIASNLLPRVPMWVLAGPDQVDTDLPSVEAVANGSHQGVQEAARWVREAIGVYDRLSTLRDSDRRLGVYGTGMLAVAAAAIADFPPEQIAAFFDDNPFLQGEFRLGRPVRALEDYAAFEITDLTYSTNPCYLDRMASRVRATLKPAVLEWPLPPPPIWPSVTATLAE